MADNIIDNQNTPVDKEPTIYDVLEAINDFSTRTDQRFDGIGKRLDKIESNMATKDYLDEKLGDLKGDLIVSMRKEDAKLRVLIEILRGKSVLSEDEEKRILSMEPFPKLYV